jgi:hypothetical protein
MSCEEKTRWSPVTDDYDPWDNAFTGKINKITVAPKEAAASIAAD